MYKIKWKFIALILISFGFVYFQGSKIQYVIFYCLIFILICGRLYLTIIKKNLEIIIRFNQEVFQVGDDGYFKLTVLNYSFFPILYLIVKEAGLEKFDKKYKGDVVNINIESTRVIEKYIRFNKRGIYEFGQVHFAINDMFHMFETKSVVNKNKSIKVYPKIYSTNNISVNGNDIFQNIEYFKGAREDSTSIKDIRKYNSGDNIKKIHWKISAKYGELFIKNYDNISGEESVVILDMNSKSFFVDDGDLLEEQLVSFYLSVIKKLSERDIKSRAIINNREKKEFAIETKDDFELLLEYFIVNESGNAVEFKQFVFENISNISRLGWIGIFIPFISKSQVDMALMLHAMGYRTTLFYIKSSYEDGDNVKKLREIGVQCLSFYEVLLIKDEVK